MVCGDVLRRRVVRPIRQEIDILLPAPGSVRFSSFRWSSDHGAYSKTGFRRKLHHPLVQRDQHLQQHAPLLVRVTPSGSRPLRAPLRRKPVRSETHDHDTHSLLFALDGGSSEVGQ